jgi:nickel superoxide dismutase
MAWTTIAVIIFAATMAFIPEMVLSHCQIPCGIYDDPAEISSMRLSAQTIEKSVASINDLSGKTSAEEQNQLVRWVNNKDEHASMIMTSIAEYFMAQRIKPVADGAEGYDAYLDKLAKHHAVMVAAMQTKQHADMEHVKALKAAIDGIAPFYTE